MIDNLHEEERVYVKINYDSGVQIVSEPGEI